MCRFLKNRPPQYLPLEDDETYAKNVAKQATSYAALQADIQQLFMISDETIADEFRLGLAQKYAEPHPKAHLFVAAQKKIYQHMMDEMTDIRTNLTQLEMDVAA